MFNISATLFDATWSTMKLSPLALAVLALVGYSAYRLFRDETRETAWLLATMGFAIAVPLVVLDLVSGSHASTVARYLTALWIAVLVSVALFLGRRLLSDERWNPLALASLCAVLFVCSVSCFINSHASIWWDNHDFPSAAMGRIISRAGSPLVLIDDGPNPLILVMSHYVKPGTRFILVADKRRPVRLLPNTFLIDNAEAAPVDQLHQYRAQRTETPKDFPWVSLYRLRAIAGS